MYSTIGRRAPARHRYNHPTSASGDVGGFTHRVLDEPMPFLAGGVIEPLDMVGTRGDHGLDADAGLFAVFSGLLSVMACVELLSVVTCRRVWGW